MVEPCGRRAFFVGTAKLVLRSAEVSLSEVLRRDAELAERVAAGSTVPAERVFLAALAEELRLEADRLDREAPDEAASF